MFKKKSDNKMTDPNILANDELLVLGDLKVEKTQPNFLFQDPPTNADLSQMKNNGQLDNGLLTVNYSGVSSTIHPVYPNPKVKAVNGSYSNNVVNKGWQYYGTPYEYGSDRSKPNTFDCSDYTRWLYLYTLGMDLPKTSSTQWDYVKKYSKHKYYDLSQAKRGDLLFFMGYRGYQAKDYSGINVKAQTVQHCGIYIGDGKIIHTASQKTGGVRVDKIAGTHLQYRFIGGGQVLQ